MMILVAVAVPVFGRLVARVVSVSVRLAALRAVDIARAASLSRSDVIDVFVIVLHRVPV